MYFSCRKINLYSIQLNQAVLKILKNVRVNKAAGIENISGRFLKDSVDILAIPVTQICNLSIKPSHFPHDCKLAKLKPLYKKVLKQILKIIGQSPSYLQSQKL